MAGDIGDIEIGSYDESALREALIAIQEHFGADSPTFYAAYLQDRGDLGGRVSWRDQHRWADYYSEWLELTGAASGTVPHEGTLVGHVRRELAAG